MGTPDLSAVTTGLVDALPDPVIVLDAPGQLQWGNRAAERLFGRTLQGSYGLPALELVHPDDLELVRRSLASVQRKEVGTLIEVRVMTARGWRLVEVIGAPVPWLNQETAVVFCLRDLTDRRRFEVARNQDALFRSLVHNSPTMTILLSREGSVECSSGALSRVLGHDPEQVERRRFVDLMAEEDRPAFTAALAKVSEGATASNPVTARVRLPRYPTREPVLLELTLVNLLDDPTVRGFLVSAQNITARAKAERELQDELVAHARTAARLLASLTPREREVLDLLGQTETASQMAERLFVSVRTVESHLANAYRKLGVHTRATAAAEYDRLGRTVAGSTSDH